MRKKDYDFAGYVTKNNIRCTDGVVIKQDAFKGNHERQVPLVWQHNYSQPGNTLGHMVLENVADGVYGYGYFNNSATAENAKELIRHGDIRAMSIGANKIQKMGTNVIHGNIYEVSLVLSGANAGATIEYTNLAHTSGEDFENGEAIIEPNFLIHSAEDEDNIFPAEEEQEDAQPEEEAKEERSLEEVIGSLDEEQAEAVAFLLSDDEGDEAISHDDTEGGSSLATDQSTQEDGRTVKDVLDTLNDDQRAAVAFLLEEQEGETDETVQQSDDYEEYEGEEGLKHSVFNEGLSAEAGYVTEDGSVLTHGDANAILAQAVTSKVTSVVDVFANAGISEDDLKHGISNIEALFPNTTATGGVTVVNPQGKNVEKILNSISKSPFSRVKNLFADITDTEARARGYIKGHEKLDSIADIFYRETTPGTIYVRQKLDRDDVLDIGENGIDIISFANAQMQAKLKEEIVKAVLVGDGRPRTVSSGGSTILNPDKIDEQRIRPIATDNDLFTIKATADSLAGAAPTTNASGVVTTHPGFVETFITAQAAYQGSGNGALYIHPITLAKLRLLTDANGRWIFGGYANGGIPTNASVAAALGVSEVVEYLALDPKQIIYVDLSDYKLGAAKGGQVTNFDFFDIDFNQYKYLSETRLSGALTIPKSAIVITLGANPATTAEVTAVTGVPKGDMKQIPSWVTDSGTTLKP